MTEQTLARSFSLQSFSAGAAVCALWVVHRSERKSPFHYGSSPGCRLLIVDSTSICAINCWGCSATLKGEMFIRPRIYFRRF